ncbi:UNVERIFIED_CONTAM: hypothetical protein FKN15_035277 [Acipenser sinensis]
MAIKLEQLLVDEAQSHDSYDQSVRLHEHENSDSVQKRPSKRPAEGGKKVPAPLPVTPRGGKGEKAPEAAGPSAPPESARGEKAAEWTVVARRKKKVAARSTGAAEQGATKTAAATSGGGSGGPPEKGTPTTAPPARQGGKALRKTKHLIPTEGEVRSAAGGVLPVAVGTRREALPEVSSPLPRQGRGQPPAASGGRGRRKRAFPRVHESAHVPVS